MIKYLCRLGRNVLEHRNKTADKRHVSVRKLTCFHLCVLRKWTRWGSCVALLKTKWQFWVLLAGFFWFWCRNSRKWFPLGLCAVLWWEKDCGTQYGRRWTLHVHPVGFKDVVVVIEHHEEVNHVVREEKVHSQSRHQVIRQNLWTCAVIENIQNLRLLRGNPSNSVCSLTYPKVPN